MRNKIISGFIILLVLISFKGCFNYTDINKVTFATSIIFDISEDNQIIVYVDSVKPYRSTNESSDKGRRIIYKGQGVSTIDALTDVNLASSFEINYSQNRAYIFTERAAVSGIEKFLNLIENNQQFQVKPYMYVYYGDIDDLLETTSNDEEYLGLYLEDLVAKNDASPRAINANINDYLNSALMEENTYIIGDIALREDALDKKIEIGGGAILKENKLVDKMDSKQARGYNILMNNLYNGVIDINNPQDDGGLLSFKILGTSIKTDLEVKDEEIIFIKDIYIKASLVEVENNFNMNREAIKLIKSNKEKNLEKELKNLFDTYKEKNLDVFDVKRILNVNYPKLTFENALSKTNIKVNVHLDFQGSSVIKSTY